MKAYIKNGEIQIEVTRKEADAIIAYIEDYLIWFKAVAIPLYARVFAPSNSAGEKE